ncbi:MAG: hypothetical protein HYR84_03680 [Planctomycetes bacterium]|nr:hypothetical protein [Planctomycetota bacterium]
MHLGTGPDQERLGRREEDDRAGAVRLPVFGRNGRLDQIDEHLGVLLHLHLRHEGAEHHLHLRTRRDQIVNLVGANDGILRRLLRRHDLDGSFLDDVGQPFVGENLLQDGADRDLLDLEGNRVVVIDHGVAQRAFIDDDAQAGLVLNVIQHGLELVVVVVDRHDRVEGLEQFHFFVGQLLTDKFLAAFRQFTPVGGKRDLAVGDDGGFLDAHVEALYAGFACADQVGMGLLIAFQGIDPVLGDAAGADGRIVRGLARLGAVEVARRGPRVLGALGADGGIDGIEAGLQPLPQLGSLRRQQILGTGDFIEHFGQRRFRRDGLLLVGRLDGVVDSPHQPLHGKFLAKCGVFQTLRRDRKHDCEQRKRRHTG